MKIPRFPAALLINATLAAFCSTLTPAGAQEAAPPAPAPGVPAINKIYLSSGAEDVLKLARAKVNDDVTIAFIQSSNRRFDLSANDILYLRKEGVSDRVLTAMLGQQPPPAAQPAVTPPPTAPTSAEPTATYAEAPQYVSPPVGAATVQVVPASTVYVATTPAYYSFCDPWPYWSTWYPYPAFSIGFYWGWGWGWGGCGWAYPSYCYNGYWNNYCQNNDNPPPPPPNGNPPPPNENRPPPPGSTSLIAEGRQPSGVNRGTPLVSEMRQPTGVSRGAPLVSEMRQPSGVNQASPLTAEGRQPSGVSGANQAAARPAVSRTENRSAAPTSHWIGNRAQAATSRPGANPVATGNTRSIRPVAPAANPGNQTFSAGRGELRNAGSVSVGRGGVNQRAAAPTYVNRPVSGGSRSSSWSQPFVASGSRYGSSPRANYSSGGFRPSPSYQGGGFNAVSRPSMSRSISPSYRSPGVSGSFRGGSGFSGMSAPRMSAGGGGIRGGGGRSR